MLFVGAGGDGHVLFAATVLYGMLAKCFRTQETVFVFCKQYTIDNTRG